MARKRMLHPEFFSSTTINQLSIPQAMTFAGLWIYVDDSGRGEDDPIMVKASVWPRRRTQTEARVAADLAELAAHGLICRYDVNAYPVLHVMSWYEHQKISHPTLSKLPPCPTHEPGLWAAYLQDDDTALAKFRCASGGIPEPFRSDSKPVQLRRVEGSSRAVSDPATRGSVDVAARAAEIRASFPGRRTQGETA